LENKNDENLVLAVQAWRRIMVYHTMCKRKHMLIAQERSKAEHQQPSNVKTNTTKSIAIVRKTLLDNVNDHYQLRGLTPCP